MKVYVIGLTTFRELVRRPFYWLSIVGTAVLLMLFIVIPYFTLGEDIKMLKDQGLVVIMMLGMVIALFAASVSIADEIEGKTAVTLLSKPITRRSFVVGKYLGILAAVALMFVVLGVVLLFCVYYKVFYDAREYSLPRPTTWEPVPMVLGMLPGLVLSFCQVAIICSLSVAFSARIPVHLNITACIAIYLLGHLAAQMKEASNLGKFEAVKFMAQFFSTVLPGLEYFNVSPAISTDTPVPWVQYVLPCLAYSALYITAALTLALLLFEDRDLA